MRHFIGFSILIFAVLFVTYFNREDLNTTKEALSIKVYADSSFIGSWGPGPHLKELFEKQTNAKIVFIDMKESNSLLQKMAIDGKSAVGDVIISLDQFDIVRLSELIQWRPLVSKLDSDASQSYEVNPRSDVFLPYDWAPISINGQKNNRFIPKSLDDLLNSEMKGQLALLDPRTSSPGLQFLVWVMKTKSEPEAIEYLKKLNQQVHSYSPSWSVGYGLFKNNQADYVLSYATSPFYHLVEEKDDSYKSYEFSEGHPIQVEFAGVPDTCENCDLAIQFVQFLQSPEAQKIIMTRNYMLPVYKSAQETTVFDTLKIYKTYKNQKVTKDELQRWLNLWSEIRQNEPDSR